MRLHPALVAAFAVALAGCGGALSADQGGDASSGPADGAPEDATLPEDSASDAACGGQFPVEAAVDAVDEGPADADASPSFCEEDAAVDGGCACSYGDAQSWCLEDCWALHLTGACGLIGLHCGFGCAPQCDCTDAGWRCIVPPCLPPSP
jgi:hypothetical protein